MSFPSVSRISPPFRGETGHPVGLLFGDSHPVDGFQVRKNLLQLSGGLDFLADQTSLPRRFIKILLVDGNVIEHVENLQQPDFPQVILLQVHILGERTMKVAVSIPRSGEFWAIR